MTTMPMEMIETVDHCGRIRPRPRTGGLTGVGGDGGGRGVPCLCLVLHHTLLHVGKVSLYYLAAYIGGALPVSCATTYCASEGASTPLLFGVSVFHATCFE